MKATQMDATKDGVRSYIDDAKECFKGGSKQAQHKLAVLNFILDSIGVDDEAIRRHALEQLAATPSPFGCNDSALDQLLGTRKPGVKASGLAAFLAAEKSIADEPIKIKP